MCTEIDIVELVRQAQRGDQQAMDHLAQVVTGRLYAYINRLTLNHDLTQDLLQETLLKMIESIKDIEHPDRFWPWLFRTALGQVQHYYRERARAQQVEFSSMSRRRLLDYLARDHDDGLDRLMRRELAEAVVDAMAQLNLAYRNVLTLRCYEQLSFAEIAEMMDCKELRARVLFFRARHSLNRRLAKRGFGKGLLLTALGLFGLLTAPADSASAATTVTAASIQVGAAATIAGIAGTPSGFAVILTVAGMTFTLSLSYQHMVYVFLLGGLLVISYIIALFFE
ncbi:MAG TPA: sigma-70 family RNA polymerase sigma factor [Sedimentisphaerales bacterium]|nr:sigma-70 family RNA polymerase sigma factor [Sedimentisphaerales bacterium]HRS11035.1 sigma-70 family RNA polymerase sigma factor [Sedimentisphaerales bacterium]HRV49707.1 sigma-70 family RNA polymerase sigma factor [Sedimentisphaerales bacterium]